MQTGGPRTLSTNAQIRNVWIASWGWMFTSVLGHFVITFRRKSANRSLRFVRRCGLYRTHCGKFSSEKGYYRCYRINVEDIQDKNDRFVRAPHNIISMKSRSDIFYMQLFVWKHCLFLSIKRDNTVFVQFCLRNITRYTSARYFLELIIASSSFFLLLSGDRIRLDLIKIILRNIF